MADGQSDIAQASARLERAVAALEGRVRALGSKTQGSEGNLFSHGRPGNGGPSERERALEAAALEASAALGRAAAEMRAALAAAAADDGEED